MMVLNIYGYTGLKVFEKFQANRHTRAFYIGNRYYTRSDTFTFLLIKP